MKLVLPLFLIIVAGCVVYTECAGESHERGKSVGGPEQQAALAKELRMTMAAALRTGLFAKKSQDVDAPKQAIQTILDRYAPQDRSTKDHDNQVIARIQALLERTPPQDNFTQELTNLVDWEAKALLEFLVDWQGYIAAIETGEREGLRPGLPGFLGTGAEFPDLISRPELLTAEAQLYHRMVATPERANISVGSSAGKARWIMLQTNSLADLPKAIEQMETLLRTKPANDMPREELERLLRLLHEYQSGYEAIKKGLTAEVRFASPAPDRLLDEREHAAALHHELLLLALPGMLGLPATKGTNPGESVSGYLQRMATTAINTADWPLLERTLSIKQYSDNDSTCIATDRLALQCFIDAIHQEQAQKYALAVRSFRFALQTGSEVIPPETIGKHLQTIRQEHLADYEQAVRDLEFGSIPTTATPDVILVPPARTGQSLTQ